jgi:dTDP-4-amino-4,6-dideoxygalactose transaminase
MDFHHLFVVRVRDRDGLARLLGEYGVETKVHYPEPLHRLGGPWEPSLPNMPNADRWCGEILSLPCFPGLTTQEIDRVCAALELYSERLSLKV